MGREEEIFRAVAENDAASVDALLSGDASLARAVNGDRLSVLQFARFMGRDAVLESLIAVGPPLDVFDAASLDRTTVVSDLLARDPSVAAAYSADGFTALHFASYYGAASAVRALLDAGASTAAVTKNFLENMPLHAAAAGGHLSIMELLLERGADANARQHGGFTAMHTAAQHGSRAMVELLLRYGADPAAATDDGETPAARARSQGNSAVAALLDAKTPQ
jgi:ankyrin repeat protein